MTIRKLTACIAALLLLIFLGWIYYPAPSLPSGTKASRIVIHKSDHSLILYAKDKPIKTYRVSLGRGGLSPKQHEGDKKTPEGHYIIDHRNKNSGYYRSLHISYPNMQDRARAAKTNQSPGGDIMIHGLRNGMDFIGSMHLLIDWTRGCIALTNAEMDELWSAVPSGTPVEIFP